MKKNPVCMFDVDGTFIREFYNIADAIKQYKSANSTNRKIKVIVNGETKIFNSMSQDSKEIGISRDTLRKYNKIRNISWEIL